METPVKGRRFTATAAAASRDRVLIPVPFNPNTADDVAAALQASPQAAAGFDSLAQFYRRAYLRWIDATRRRPEQRAQRIAEMIQLLEAGHKQRPHS